MGVSKKSWLAVAREATPLTAITTPTVYVPGKAKMKGVRKPIYLDEERGTRDQDNDVQYGNRWNEWSSQGAWYNDTDPYFVLAALGADTATQPDAAHAATVYSHAIALADVPPTLTIYRNVDPVVYYSAGSFVEKFSFKWSSEKLLEFDVSGKGLFKTKYAGAPLTPTYSTVKAIAGYAPLITLSGTQTGLVDEMEMTFTQKATPWFPSQGSPDFSKIDFGGRSVEGSFTARFDDESIYQKWVTASTATPADDTLSWVANGALIANSGPSGTPPNTNYFQSVAATLYTVNYDEMEADYGKDVVTLKVKWHARPVPTHPLIAMTIQNTIANYTV